jgi:hypothetical protein
MFIEPLATNMELEILTSKREFDNVPFVLISSLLAAAADK